MESTNNRTELHKKMNGFERVKHDAVQQAKKTWNLIKGLVTETKAIRSKDDVEKVVRTYCMQMEIIYVSLFLTWMMFAFIIDIPIRIGFVSAVLAILLMAVFAPSVIGVMAYVYDMGAALIDGDKDTFVRQFKRFVMITLPVAFLIWAWAFIVIKT